MSILGKYGLRAQPPNEYVSTDINIQLMAIEVEDLPIESTLDEEYNESVIASDQFISTLPPENAHEYVKRKAVAYLFGAEEHTGATVCVKVDKFRPVLYYHTNDSVSTLKNKIDESLKLKGDIDAKVIKRKRTYGFHPDKDDSTSHEQIRIVEVSFPSVSKMKAACYRSGDKEPPETRLPKPWEQGVDPGSMFMERNGLTPCGWFKMKACKTITKHKISHCTMEFEVSNPKNIQPVDLDKIAPILIASYDFEMYSETRGFPMADRQGDHIAIIGVAFWRLGTPVEDTKTVLLCLNECAQVEGSYVESYNTEAELYNAFRDLITVHSDADVCTGYNIFGFDNEYITTRAKMCKASRFAYNGRLITVKTESQAKELESSALGQNRMFPIEWKGRCNFDLFNFIKSNHKLSLYGLGPVSQHFIGETKVDLPYKEMFDCVRPGATPEEVARAAAYCKGDVLLPIRLMKALQVMPGMIEMSRVTFTTINQLVFRGQSIKVMQQITRYSHQLGHVVNPVPRPINTSGYEGAIVIDAKSGFYTDPVATLDFASLYPSIMLAHNLCYSTFVEKGTPRVDGVEYETHKISPTEEYTFALNVPGVLTHMLKYLLGARKKAKKQMAAAKTPEEKAIYNARQLALKISCNSIYGFCGAEKLGKYPLGAIAKCTTFNGRKMINKTSEMAIELFKPWIAEIIYGDTDSVFVRVKDKNGKELTPAEVFKVGEDVAQKISDSFREDIELEMEKVYSGFLLITKKRYFGGMHEPNKAGDVVFSKVDAKGVELIRRDNCPLLRNLYKKIVDSLVFDKDPLKALASVKETLERVVNDEVPYEEYIITKELRKEESYANPKQEQLMLAKKISARTNGGVTPQPGDRIPFVIRYDKHAKHICDRAEDLDYLRENNIPLDRLYYITNKITKPILTIFQAFKEHIHDVQRTIQSAMSRVQLQLDKQPTITSFFNKLPPLPVINMDVDDENDHGIAWDDDTHTTDMEIEQPTPKKGFKRPQPPTHNKNLLARKKLRH